jgi:hypothetical protein
VKEMDKNVSLKPRFLFRRSIVYMKKRGKCSLIFLPNYVITLIFIYYFFVVCARKRWRSALFCFMTVSAFFRRFFIKRRRRIREWQLCFAFWPRHISFTVFLFWRCVQKQGSASLFFFQTMPSFFFTCLS